MLLPREREARARRQLDECTPGTFEALCSVVTGDDRVVELRWTVSCELVNDKRVLRGLMIDVTEARRLVREIAQGQKLESVGRIAAGVAHEINTSVQFISDSVRFVRHALQGRAARARRLPRARRRRALGQGRDRARRRRASETDEAADVDYFLKNAPDALDRALEGIGRVGSIVSSMTEFAHPDSHTMADVDINRAITDHAQHGAQRIQGGRRARHRFRRHSAGALPRGRRQPGGAQPAAQRRARHWRRGRGHQLQGPHHGAHARHRRLTSRFPSPTPATAFPNRCARRIFEPFVTTKEVGRGTGQGLALSRGIVVEKLKGSLHFETETGKGTTFFIRLPVSDQAIPATTKQAAA